tara:strand:- start:3669 stop:5321 length:1653 start_codon:yes stop_codon:yes gene_type:complete
MPTESSYPLNVIVNGVIQADAGAKWKKYQAKSNFNNNNEVAPIGNFIYPKRFTYAGMTRPFFNKQGGSSYEAGAMTGCNKSTDNNTLAYTGTGCPYADYTGSGDGNAFRARPMKHWRLQYGDTNNKQSYFSRYVLSNFEKPGGFTTGTYHINDIDGISLVKETNENKQNCVEFKNPNSSTITGNLPYTVGKFNKVGKYNPIYFTSPAGNPKASSDEIENGLFIPNYYPSKKQVCLVCPNYYCTDFGSDSSCDAIKKCVNICDPPSKALNRVRYPVKFNSYQMCERPYYQNSSSYLRARCKLYSQNSFQFKPRHYESSLNEKAYCGNSTCSSCPNCGIYTVTENGVKVTKTIYCKKCCGISAYNSQKFRSNCPEVTGLTSCKGDTSTSGSYSTTCSTVYYKPNNCQFAQQGAVSSSSRILRLKVNTINKNAKYVGNSYGTSASTELAYSGSAQAPFINKQKMNAGGYSRKCQNVEMKYPCDTNLYYIYRPGGGNPTTSGMNTINNERIIGHFNSTSEFPGQGSNGNIGAQNFYFMQRQSKQVQLTGISTIS